MLQLNTVAQPIKYWLSDAQAKKSQRERREKRGRQRSSKDHT